MVVLGAQLTNSSAIEEAYGSLHAAGVVHMDTELWNVCARGDDTTTVRLIDFETSKANGDAWFDREMEAEQKWVAETLQFMRTHG